MIVVGIGCFFLLIFYLGIKEFFIFVENKKGNLMEKESWFIFLLCKCCVIESSIYVIESNICMIES